MSELQTYDPNIRWSKQTVRVKFMQWGYRAEVVAVVGGNCQGFDTFESAISAVCDGLPTTNYDGVDAPVAKLILTADNGDTLECEDEDVEMEDWLKPMVVGIEIIGREPEEKR